MWFLCRTYLAWAYEGLRIQLLSLEVWGCKEFSFVGLVLKG